MNKLQEKLPTAVMLEPLVQFKKDSIHLLNKCTKPTLNEWSKIARFIAMGFLVMGLIGFVVKLVFIPINHLLIGA